MGVNLTGSPNNNSSNNQGNDDSDTSISGSNASIDGTKPSDLQQAVETYKSNPADQNATNTIKKILEAQRECSSLFVTNYDQCKNIEDTGFQNALKQIPQDVQETLGSGFAPETDFQGNFVPTQDISIDPSGVSTFQSKDKIVRCLTFKFHQLIM
ncbi:hypothetical protein HC766_02650 [Candidatus Gracilibacteria bacterium]|nr:hypothetical protein [Candidatus Gracilibacteria bacterium]